MQKDKSPIRFFNTLSGQKENFEPLSPPGVDGSRPVGIYTCGPTVYDYAHIGNFRAFVFEDLLIRFLLARGFKVKHVMNITDVDDKTIAGANREVSEGDPRERLRRFTQKYLDAFHEDLRKLNIFLPLRENPNYEFIEPRATEEMDAIKKLIQELEKKGYTYPTQQSIYYQVSKFNRYGRLSKKRLEANIAGARVDADEYDKEAGADFALWKKEKPGEPSWPSQWGEGRPGWHIECSAMSMKYLGPQFDIHCGGEDLIFPHHENEIAQSEAATGKQPFVKYWLHCKHLLVDGEKMSKSKGNFYTLRDLLAKEHDPMAVRYVLISVHYRQPVNFTEQAVKEAEGALERLRNCYFHCFHLKNLGIHFEINKNKQTNWRYDLPTFESRIKEGMDSILGGAYYLAGLSDDLNISHVLWGVHEVVKNINSGLARKLLDYPQVAVAINFFRDLDSLLGLGITDEENVPPPEVLELQERRDAFRRGSEFIKSPELQKQSDEIRTKIQSLGWDVKDGRPGEPSIIRKRTLKQKV
jgi:cysteinyl-tRNA synthetase